jgi:4-amino-4-deoxy-L-arabinose transferase-like glycosyltransferase
MTVGSCARPVWADGGFWAPIAAALLLRGALLARYPDLFLRADEGLHLLAGALVAELGPTAVGHWPPGYELFLAGVFRAAGVDPLAAKIADVALSTLTVAAAALLARSLGGRRAGHVAGWLCALHPGLVAFSHYLYSETLFAALLTGGALFAFRRPEGATRAEQVAAGVLFGLAILTRSVLLYFLPLWVAAQALRRRAPEARRALVVTLVALAVVAPWTLRNALRYGAFVPVDSTAAMTAYFAFQPTLFNRDLGFIADWRPEGRPCPHVPLDPAPALPSQAALRAGLRPGVDAFFEAGEPLLDAKLAQVRAWVLVDWPAVARCERARAAELVRRDPAAPLRNAAGRVYAFWGPNNFLLRAVHGGEYPAPPLDRARYAWVESAVVGFHVLVLAAAILALGRRGAPALVGWTAGLAAYSTAVHAVAVSFSRYRLPLMPLLIVLASLWLARPALPEGRRWIAVGPLLIGALALCAHYAARALP